MINNDQEIRNLRIKLEQQSEASTYINDILQNPAELESTVVYLIKVALAVQEGRSFRLKSV